VLAACGLEVSRFADHRVMKWSKLLLNMTANATCALLDFTPGELYADRKLFMIEHAAFEEAAAVMRAMHLRPADLPGYPAARLWFVMQSLPRPAARYILNYRVGAARGSKQPSLRLEMERGRPESEIDWMNGAVARGAERHRLEARANRFLTRAIHDVLEQRIPWDRWRRRPDRFLADFRAAMEQSAPRGL
jgi:2-dehydropantoate 2-reductase